MLERLVALPEEINQAGQLLADAGDFSEANVTACESAGVEPAIAIKRDAHHPHWSERFKSPEAPPAEATAVERMAHRLKTPKGRPTDALRRQTVEPVFGITKSVMGFRQFLTRGLDATIAQSGLRYFHLRGQVRHAASAGVAECGWVVGVRAL